MICCIRCCLKCSYLRRPRIARKLQAVMFAEARQYAALRQQMLFTMISPEEAAANGTAAAQHAAGAAVCFIASRDGFTCQ